ncbi:MAG: hypothetical protein RIT03_2007 [Bacteroidota bacterium]
MTKIAFSAYLLLTNFILFAKDDGGDILGDGTVENDGPTNPGDVPINSYLIWLTLVAILFSLYLYKTKKVKA